MQEPYECIKINILPLRAVRERPGLHHLYYEKNLQKLAAEMYKVRNRFCPEVMKDLFVLKSSGNEYFVLPK